MIKLLLVFLSIPLYALDSAKLEEAKQFGASLSIGGTTSFTEHISCILKEKGGHCEGGEDYPEIENVKEIVGGYGYLCVLANKTVLCDGYKMNPSNLINPKTIAGGYAHVCAIDDEGIKCWGSNSFGQTRGVPHLERPIALASGNSFNCALYEANDKKDVKCWGENFGRILEVPPLKDPRQISASENHVCALHEEGVKCWGNGNENIIPPQLLNPRQISVAGSNTCALDDEGVKCWGPDFIHGHKHPQLTFPLLVRAADKYYCALDNQLGVVCWGKNFRPETNILKNFKGEWQEILPSLALDTIPAFLKRMSAYFYTSKATFIQSLSSLAKESSEGDRLSMLSFVDTFIEKITSPEIQTHIYPLFKTRLEALKTKTENISPNSFSLRTAISVSALVLNTVKDKVRVSDRQEAEVMLADLGKAQTQTEVSKVLTHHSPFIETLLLSEKTSDFARVLLQVKNLENIQ